MDINEARKLIVDTIEADIMVDGWRSESADYPSEKLAAQESAKELREALTLVRQDWYRN